MVKTDHILFIASGAFHLSKPSDLIPELQGRLPIRVELRALEVDDFTRILTEPQASLTEQYTALMSTEGVTWISARTACAGSRKSPGKSTNPPKTSAPAACTRCWSACWTPFPTRRRTVRGIPLKIDGKYVDEHLEELAGNEDLSRYIL